MLRNMKNSYDRNYGLKISKEIKLREESITKLSMGDVTFQPIESDMRSTDLENKEILTRYEIAALLVLVGFKKIYNYYK